MTKDDTYNKLRHNLFRGMMIEHKFRSIMTSPESDWYCVINEIQEDTNNLEVTIHGTTGQAHTEDWDMKITIHGLENGEYLEITT